MNFDKKEDIDDLIRLLRYMPKSHESAAADLIDKLLSERDRHKDESERWQKLYQSEIRISTDIHARLTEANSKLNASIDQVPIFYYSINDGVDSQLYFNNLFGDEVLCPLYAHPISDRQLQNERTIADYEEVLAGHRKLVRELDVLLNGDNAATQASLCDLIAQVSRAAREKSVPRPKYLITEQDAREIASHFVQWLNDFDDQRNATISKWLDEEGRALLDKLNEV